MNEDRVTKPWWVGRGGWALGFLSAGSPLDGPGNERRIVDWGDFPPPIQTSGLIGYGHTG